MKKCFFMLPVFLLMLTGCGNENELADIVPPNGEESLGKNAVRFSNNTMMTIGDVAEQTAALKLLSRAATDFPVNYAASLTMKSGGGYHYVGVGQTYTVTNEQTDTKLNIVEGGTVNFGGPGIEGFTVVNRGTLKFSSYASEQKKYTFTNCTIHTSGNLKFDGELELIDTELYVGGDLTCTKLTVKNSEKDCPLIRIKGALTQNGLQGPDKIDISGPVHMYVEGGLDAQQVSIIDNNSEYQTNVLTDAPAYIHKKLEMEDKAVWCSNGYLQAKLLRMNDESSVYLVNRGFAAFEQVEVNSGKPAFKTSGSEGALFEAGKLTILKDAQLSCDTYLNYGQFKEETKGSLKADLVNVEGVSGKAPVEGNKPTVTLPGDKPTEPEGDDETIVGPEGNTDDKVVINIPTGVDIKEDFFLKADDFAIRVDGVYNEDLIVEDNTAELDEVQITRDEMAVTVTGLKNLEVGHEYTYEVYLWVSSKTWLAFTPQYQEEWIEGADITTDCEVSYVGKGFKVRRNVYKGVSGQEDTPYIKVSVHVVKIATEMPGQEE